MRQQNNRKSWMALALAAGLCSAQLSPAATAGFDHLWLACQQEFGNKRGYILQLENNTDDTTLRAEGIRLVLGVGDGKAWRFPAVKKAWEPGHVYQVKAVLTPTGATLWLDGEVVADSPGGFAPAEGLDTLRAGLPYKATSGESQYVLRQPSLAVTIDKNKPIVADMSGPANSPLSIYLFEPQSPARLPVKLKAGQSLTIEASFSVSPRPSIKSLSPLVDQYGQAKAGDWPGKLRDDGELRQRVAQETEQLAKARPNKDFDEFGGYRPSPWREKGTGFYRTVKRDGRWFLIAPSGLPAFYAGCDTAPGTFETTHTKGREYVFEGLPPREGDLAAAWGGNGAFAFYKANLIRKYGADWKARNDAVSVARLKAWGFTGVGKWAGDFPAGAPRQPVIKRDSIPKLVKHPDIFDPAIQKQFRELLEKAIEPSKNDPTVLGWSVGNEHDEIVLKSEIPAILAKTADVPAKQALIAFAIKELYRGDGKALAKAWKIDGDPLAATNAQLPADDVEKLRQFYEEAYYKFIYTTVKSIDPNHLYFGGWICVGWWENDADWFINAKYCDVIGFDQYDPHYQNPRAAKFMKATDKPTLLGEYSFPTFYNGQRGFGAYGVYANDDADAGRLYARHMNEAATDPYCIGMHWFEYHDQPITGRDAGTSLVAGEHYAFGLVDITDTPKWGMIDAVREANLSAVKTRLTAK